MLKIYTKGSCDIPEILSEEPICNSVETYIPLKDYYT